MKNRDTGFIDPHNKKNDGGIMVFKARRRMKAAELDALHLRDFRKVFRQDDPLAAFEHFLKEKGRTVDFLTKDRKPFRVRDGGAVRGSVMEHVIENGMLPLLLENPPAKLTSKSESVIHIKKKGYRRGMIKRLKGEKFFRRLSPGGLQGLFDMSADFPSQSRILKKYFDRSFQEIFRNSIKDALRPNLKAFLKEWNPPVSFFTDETESISIEDPKRENFFSDLIFKGFMDLLEKHFEKHGVKIDYPFLQAHVADDFPRLMVLCWQHREQSLRIADLADQAGITVCKDLIFQLSRTDPEKWHGFVHMLNVETVHAVLERTGERLSKADLLRKCDVGRALLEWYMPVSSRFHGTSPTYIYDLLAENGEKFYLHELLDGYLGVVLFKGTPSDLKRIPLHEGEVYELEHFQAMIEHVFASEQAIEGLLDKAKWPDDMQREYFLFARAVTMSEDDRHTNPLIQEKASEIVSRLHSGTIQRRRIRPVPQRMELQVLNFS